MPAVGDFPFPLLEGARESPYLTWLRNHSNYMLSRGFLDYMRTAAALVRGIVVNFLIVLPYFLIISIVLGWYHYVLIDQPFYWTRQIVYITAGLLLCITVLLPGFRIFRYKRSLQTGSESTIVERDFLERLFGALLLVIIAIAGLESLPLILESLHNLLNSKEFGLEISLSAIVAAVTILSASHKLLSVLAGIKKQLAMVAIGVAGFILPLMVILLATEYLLYGKALNDRYILAPLIFPAALILTVQLAWFYMVAVWLKRIFRWREILRVQARLMAAYFIMFMLLMGVFLLDEQDRVETELAKASVDDVKTLFARIEQNFSVDRPGSEAAKLIAAVKEETTKSTKRERFEHEKQPRQSDSSDNCELWFCADKALYKLIGNGQEDRKWSGEHKKYLVRAQPLIHAVRDLSTLDELELDPLREEAIRQAPFEILQQIRGADCLGVFTEITEGYENLTEMDEKFYLSEANAQCLRNKFIKSNALRWLSIVPDPGDAVVDAEARIQYYRDLADEWNIPSLVFEEMRARLDSASVDKVAELLSDFQLRLILGGNEPETRKLKLSNVSRKELIEQLTSDHREAVLAAAMSDYVSFTEDDTDETIFDYAPYREEDMAEKIQAFLDEYALLTAEQKEWSYYVLDSLTSEDYPRVSSKYLIDFFPIETRETIAFDELFSNTWFTEPLFDSIARKRVSPVLAFGQVGLLKKTDLRSFANVFYTKAIFLGLLAFSLWLVWRFTVDVNLTSIHALYRDRLARAFLVGRDTKGDIGVEEDVDLEELCQHDAGSIAPYHLVNVALNLQGSKDPSIRDRRSDFFIFSKRFIGGDRTGYCRSETMEQVFPQMDLATAMAISAAAASPNMGRATSPLLVALMTLLNIRLGFWVPNPGLLEEHLSGVRLRQIRKARKRNTRVPGFAREEVFQQEMLEVDSRWRNVYRGRKEQDRGTLNTAPTTANRLFGLGFSGGGIRSAAINLGITQALHKRGVFDHVDYMSTVSGGGYLGSSISTLMRFRDSALAPGESRKVLQEARKSRCQSSVFGKVTALDEDAVTMEKIVSVERHPAPLRHRIISGLSRALKGPKTGDSMTVESQAESSEDMLEHRFSKFDRLAVRQGTRVRPEKNLIVRHDNIRERYRWRIRPSAFWREIASKLNETSRWVNLSDGGHIENLAAIELLRRRCKYIIIGDGEADPLLHFGGLATLMRYAKLDLGIEIDINLDAIRLQKADEKNIDAAVSSAQWAIGKIRYPKQDNNEANSNGQAAEEGYLLYLKSAVTGHENEIIREYRYRNQAFPHQSTADQFFDEGQFEAYRALGQFIAERALDGTYIPESTDGSPPSAPRSGEMSFADLEAWFEGLWENRH